MKFVTLKSAARRLKMFISRRYMHFYSLFHPIEKKIVFESFGGKQYSDNPRAISERMHILFPEYKIAWILYDYTDEYNLIPDYVIIIKDRIGKYKELATAFSYVTNRNNEPDIIKRKGQYFIQTWHGDGGFKKILYSNARGRTNIVPTIDNVITDVCMAGSTYGERKYREAFRFNGEVLSEGCARNDCLLQMDEKKIESIKKSLGIDPETKLLLYAPTFRNNFLDSQKIDVDLNEVLTHLSNSYNTHWLCLIRSHPSAEFLSDGHQDNNIINVSSYPDMADLLLISDFLITDYSSCSYDFALAYKPVILATFDHQNYIKNEREMNVKLEDTGFIYVDTQDQLISIIDTYSEEDYIKSCERVRSFYGTKETGKAADIICKRINEKYIERFE